MEVGVAAVEGAAEAGRVQGGGAGAAAGGGGGGAARAVKELEYLRGYNVNARLLQATGAGKRVRALKKCEGEVGAAAVKVVDAWKEQLTSAGAKRGVAPS